MKIFNRIRLARKLIRAKYYSFFYKIGSRCFFEKITIIANKKDLIKIGNKVVINRYTEICAGSLPIVIGDGTFINQRCLIRANTTIGKNVDIGPNVMLMTDSHEIGTKERRAGTSLFPPIKIGNGCWIGANTTILGGVTIGEGTVIGAGSLVNKDCEPNCIYAGVPAKLIRRI